VKVFYDALKRTIDNGSYAAMYSDTIALDNALARKLLTQQEHDDLVTYWHEKNDPPVVEPEPPAAPAGEPAANG